MTRNTIIIALAALLAACGTFKPLVEPREDTTASGEDEISLQPVEGRLESLVLEIRLTRQPTPGDTLEIYRAGRDGQYAMLQLVDIDAALSKALVGGIQWVDRELPPGTYSYVAVWASANDEDSSESRPVEIEWSAPPPRPSSLRTRTLSPHVIELTWEPGQRSVAIFRRDVLDPEARPQRIADLNVGSPARFVDGGLKPGGVYAYRIAWGSPANDFVHFGAPSDEIYVTLAGGEP